MNRVTIVGSPLSDDIKKRLCTKAHQPNPGATLGTDDIVYGLKEAAKLITDEVVAEETSAAA